VADFVARGALGRARIRFSSLTASKAATLMAILIIRRGYRRAGERRESSGTPAVEKCKKPAFVRT
jgi:hypothetical protein